MGANLVAASSQYLVGDEANRNARLPAYRGVDVQASWKITPAIELFGRIDNLFDSRAATYGTYFETDAIAFGNFTDPRSVSPGRPRAFYAGIRATF